MYQAPIVVAATTYAPTVLVGWQIDADNRRKRNDAREAAAASEAADRARRLEKSAEAEDRRLRALPPPSAVAFDEAVLPGFYMLVLGEYQAQRTQLRVRKWAAPIRGSCRAWRDWSDDAACDQLSYTVSPWMHRLAEPVISEWVARACRRDLPRAAIVDLYRLAAYWNDVPLLDRLRETYGLYGRAVDKLLEDYSRNHKLHYHPHGMISTLAERGCVDALAWLVDTLHIRRKTVRKRCRDPKWPAAHPDILEWLDQLP
jgi:hypothetical protein